MNSIGFPSDFLTTTLKLETVSTPSGFSGTLQMISIALSEIISQADPPIVTILPKSEKFDPFKVISSPPLPNPIFGLTKESLG